MKGGVRKDVWRLSVINILSYIKFIFIWVKMGVIIGMMMKIILIKLIKKFVMKMISIIVVRKV